MIIERKHMPPHDILGERILVRAKGYEGITYKYCSLLSLGENMYNATQQFLNKNGLNA